MNYSQKEKRAKNNFRRVASILLLLKSGRRFKPSRIKLSKSQMTEHTYKVSATAAGHEVVLCLRSTEEGNNARA